MTVVVSCDGRQLGVAKVILVCYDGMSVRLLSLGGDLEPISNFYYIHASSVIRDGETRKGRFFEEAGWRFIWWSKEHQRWALDPSKGLYSIDPHDKAVS